MVKILTHLNSIELPIHRPQSSIFINYVSQEKLLSNIVSQENIVMPNASQIAN